MNHEQEYQEFGHRKNSVSGVFIGLLVGGLAGAVTMLLMAPQSGRQTRKQIEDKSIELRDKATTMVEGTTAQIRSKANEFMTSGRKNFKELKHQGQEMALEQLNRVTEAVKPDKPVVQNA